MLALIGPDGEQSPPRSSWLPSALSLGHHSTNRCRGWLGAISEAVLTLTEERQTVNTRMWDSELALQLVHGKRSCQGSAAPFCLVPVKPIRTLWGSWAGKPLCPRQEMKICSLNRLIREAPALEATCWKRKKLRVYRLHGAIPSSLPWHQGTGR